MTDLSTAPAARERLAPAKINLALHVTGRRDDGYHLLDMLVAFAGHGDLIRVAAAEADGFTVGGRFGAGVPRDGGNLVLRARDALRAHAGRDLPPVAIHLDKRLPVAAGVGGGSSDAAATLLALNDFWGLGLEVETLAALGLPLGADLPMCLHGAADGAPLTARGIGEALSPARGLPALPLLLVNDGTAVSTPEVFRALTRRDNPALPAPRPGDVAALCAQLKSARNDLLPAALGLAPQIAAKLALLDAQGPLHTQMSGSGATCFAIFEDDVAANRAADAIAALRPDWFVLATRTAPSRG